MCRFSISPMSSTAGLHSETRALHCETLCTSHSDGSQMNTVHFDGGSLTLALCRGEPSEIFVSLTMQVKDYLISMSSRFDKTAEVCVEKRFRPYPSKAESSAPMTLTPKSIESTDSISVPPFSSSPCLLSSLVAEDNV